VALAYSGGSLGAVVTPIIITPIAAAWGWRSAFWFTGLIGLGWIILWQVVSRRPDLQPRDVVDEAARSTASLRFSDRRLWAFMSSYALGAMPLGFILYIAAIYLNQALGKTQVEIGKVLWIPPLGWEAGYFSWGFVTDRAVRRGASSVRAHRRLFLLALVFSLPLAVTPRLAAYPLVMGELFLAMFVAAGFVILSISYAMSIYSSQHSGFIAGLGAGSWSAIIAIVMPYFGRLFDQQQYERAFILATGFPVAGFALWLWLSREPRRSG
jgi:ACS family hexuronate transporter-like MFS transporter